MLLLLSPPFFLPKMPVKKPLPDLSSAAAGDDVCSCECESSWCEWSDSRDGVVTRGRRRKLLGRIALARTWTSGEVGEAGPAADDEEEDDDDDDDEDEDEEDEKGSLGRGVAI